jgi:hypothetical protein
MILLDGSVGAVQSSVLSARHSGPMNCMRAGRLPPRADIDVHPRTSEWAESRLPAPGLVTREADIVDHCGQSMIAPSHRLASEGEVDGATRCRFCRDCVASF